jgi:hypothetical protein
MELVHIYVKLRKEFGKHPYFTAVPADVLEAIPSSDHYKESYVLRNPSVTCFDTAPAM